VRERREINGAEIREGARCVARAFDSAGPRLVTSRRCSPPPSATPPGWHSHSPPLCARILPTRKTAPGPSTRPDPPCQPPSRSSPRNGRYALPVPSDRHNYPARIVGVRRRVATQRAGNPSLSAIAAMLSSWRPADRCRRLPTTAHAAPEHSTPLPIVNRCASLSFITAAGLSVREHQERTVASYLVLRRPAPGMAGGL